MPSVSFDVPPGLRDEFRFTQGQFVTLKTHIDGEETRRSYSICVGATNYDRDGELRIGIKRVRAGAFRTSRSIRSSPVTRLMSRRPMANSSRI